MTNRNRVRLSKLSLGLAIALAAAPAFAQNTSAALGGRITGGDGQPVVGAQVTITHTQSGTSSSALTGADGRYAARGLRVGGPYTVTITKDGKTETRENVYLQLAETATVDAKLGDATTTLAAVQVTGTAVTSEVFSATNMGAGTSISREQIDGFASIQRSLQDYARFDPRLSQTDKDRGEISAGGQNSRFNSVTIDGVNTSDTFGLEANNLPTIKQPISIDAIESVQVNISNVDTTQRGYTGANINAVTKSGTNEFHGSLYYVFRDEEISGDRYVRSSDTYVPPAAFDEKTWGFNFGGPLFKDRLFFFVSYEDFESTRLSAEFVPFGNTSGTQVFITDQQIADTIGVAQNTWGMDIGTTGSAATSVTKVTDKLIKLDWNINEDHRATFRYNETEQTDPFLVGFGSRNLSLSSHWYDQTKVFESFVGQLFSDWTENFSTEFRASRRSYDSIPINASRLPSVDVRFVGATPPGFVPADGASGFRTLRFGTEVSRQFNELITDTDTLFLSGNLFVGDHEFKGGVDWERTDFFNAFLQNVNGNYVFGCLFTAQCANSFQSGRPLSYLGQLPLPGRSIQDAVARFDLGNLGLFFQDTWSVNYNLTVVAGLRVDETLMPDEPIFNVAAAGAPGPLVNGRATGGFLRDNRITLDGELLWQPRLGLNYTFDSERPTQLRAGLGLFQGSAANVWLSNLYSNTGSATGVFGCGTQGFAACPTTGTPLFSPNPDTQPSIGTVPAATVDFLHENLDQPSVWKYNIAFEHEMPFWGTVFSAEFIKTKVEDAIYYQHLNLGDPTATGSDGRPLFWTPGGFNTACFNQSTGVLITTGACSGANAPRARSRSNASFANVVLAAPTGKGGGENFTIALSRPRQGDDWSWSLAYSYTEATEVNPLGSSVSYSNWIGRASFDPNAQEEARSAYVNRDRFLANVSWRHFFFDGYATEIGLFYEGRVGKPYSWVYGNDMNGDGVTGNDLMFIPTAQGSGEVVFAGGAAAEQTFWNIVNNNPYLRRYAGGVTQRASALAPWTNNFDLRISQQFRGFWEGHKAHLTFDILNVGNLINKDWGHIDEVAFQGSGTNSIGGNQARSFVNYLGRDAQGRYIYGLQSSTEDFVTKNFRGESAWAAQVTVRYEF